MGQHHDQKPVAADPGELIDMCRPYIRAASSSRPPPSWLAAVARGYDRSVNIDGLLRAAENVRAMDGLARRAQAIARRAFGVKAGRALRGSWLGHPVHPLLIVGPIGAWLSASALDVGGRHREAARFMVGIGLLATPATAVAGVADWSDMTGPRRRIGTLHAATNAAATGCYLASYLSRRRGAHATGTAWAALGLAGIGVGGALGGHLAYALGGGVYRWQAPHEEKARQAR